MKSEGFKITFPRSPRIYMNSTLIFRINKETRIILLEEVSVKSMTPEILITPTCLERKNSGGWLIDAKIVSPNSISLNESSLSWPGSKWSQEEKLRLLWGLVGWTFSMSYLIKVRPLSLWARWESTTLYLDWSNSWQCNGTYRKRAKRLLVRAWPNLHRTNPMAQHQIILKTSSTRRPTWGLQIQRTTLNSRNVSSFSKVWSQKIRILATWMLMTNS
jgi:hypothetical protein